MNSESNENKFIEVPISQNDLKEKPSNSLSKKIVLDVSVNGKTQNSFDRFEKTTIPDLSLISLSPDDRQIIDEWSRIEIMEFSCQNLASKEVNFVLIPIGYPSIPTEDSDDLLNIKIAAEWVSWSIIQREPFSSYKDTIKSSIFFPTVEAKGYFPLNILPTAEARQKQNSINEMAITTQSMTAKKEIEKNCPNVKAVIAESSRPIYIFLVKNPIDPINGSPLYSTDNAGDNASMQFGAFYTYVPGYQIMLSKKWHFTYFEYHATPTHELGHAFAGFLDEYQMSQSNVFPSEEDEYIDKNGVKVRLADRETPFNRGELVPSCLSLKNAQAAWSDLLDTKINFYPGCYGYSNRYKSSKDSIMGTGTQFDLVQQRFLCKLMEKKIGTKLGVCNNF